MTQVESMPKRTYKTFGARLRELREAADMTQEQLAGAAGVSVGTVRTLEQKATDPKLSTLCALARAMNLSLDAFSGVCNESAEPDQSDPKPKRKK